MQFDKIDGCAFVNMEIFGSEGTWFTIIFTIKKENNSSYDFKYEEYY